MWSLRGSAGVKRAGSAKKSDVPPMSLVGGSHTCEPASETATPASVPVATFPLTAVQSVASKP